MYSVTIKILSKTSICLIALGFRLSFVEFASVNTRKVCSSMAPMEDAFYHFSSAEVSAFSSGAKSLLPYRYALSLEVKKILMISKQRWPLGLGGGGEKQERQK